MGSVMIGVPRMCGAREVFLIIFLALKCISFLNQDPFFRGPSGLTLCRFNHEEKRMTTSSFPLFVKVTSTEIVPSLFFFNSAE